MTPKFKIGDRVVVSAICSHVLGDSDFTRYQNKHGEVVSVSTYSVSSGSMPDYDVYIDDFPSQHNNGCPAFDECWLTLEQV